MVLVDYFFNRVWPCFLAGRCAGCLGIREFGTKFVLIVFHASFKKLQCLNKSGRSFRSLDKTLYPHSAR